MFEDGKNNVVLQEIRESALHIIHDFQYTVVSLVNRKNGNWRFTYKNR
jgi:hypothetical protein